MASTSDFLIAGRLVSVYGVKGWLKARSYTEPDKGLFNYQPWFLVNSLGESRPISVEQWQPHNKGFVVKLAGIDNRLQAESVVAVDVSVKKECLPTLEQDQYYWHQLQDLRVISHFDGDEIDLGRVIKLMSTGANDVLVIQGDNESVDRRERLVPYVFGQHVKRVDIGEGSIYVDWDPEF